MPFIRLSDNYIDHPKFAALRDGAFRLWHETMAFCRKHQTDGMVPKANMRGFKSYSPRRLAELTAPHREGAHPLLAEVSGFGFKVHDYLEWNPSKDEENERRAESKQRMRSLRERRGDKCDAVTDAFVTRCGPSVTNAL